MSWIFKQKTQKKIVARYFIAVHYHSPHQLSYSFCSLGTSSRLIGVLCASIGVYINCSYISNNFCCLTHFLCLIGIQTCPSAGIVFSIHQKIAYLPNDRLYEYIFSISGIEKRIQLGQSGIAFSYRDTNEFVRKSSN
jgi:hypothetical protein